MIAMEMMRDTKSRSQVGVGLGWLAWVDVAMDTDYKNVDISIQIQTLGFKSKSLSHHKHVPDRRWPLPGSLDTEHRFFSQKSNS